MVGKSDRSKQVAAKEKRRAGDMKESIVRSIVASKAKSKTLKKASHTKKFLDQYFEDVPVEDLRNRPAKLMARAAIDHLDFGAQRRSGQALLRIFNATEKNQGYNSPYTFVEMINDDMPFLVDSIAAAFDGHDLAVHITVHPVISVQRDSKGALKGIAKPGDAGARPESFIRFAIDRVSDPAALKALRQEIKKVLADVRVAVRDWQKMRDRMLETREMLENGPIGVDPLLRTESQALLDWLAADHFTFLGYREMISSETARAP